MKKWKTIAEILRNVPKDSCLKKTLIILRKKKENEYLCPGGPRYRKLPVAFITF